MTNDEFYEKWSEQWKLENPNKALPTKEGFLEMVEMFKITPEELGL